jgi:hypothetical protein
MSGDLQTIPEIADALNSTPAAVRQILRDHGVGPVGYDNGGDEFLFDGAAVEVVRAMLVANLMRAQHQIMTPLPGDL